MKVYLIDADRGEMCLFWNSAAFQTAVFEIMLFQVWWDKAYLLKWFDLFLEKRSAVKKSPFTTWWWNRLCLFFPKVRTGERVRVIESLDYIVLCISEKSFGTVVIVLECTGDKCPR